MSGSNISFKETIARLTESSLPYETLELSHGAILVILQRGGRILGPFCDNEKSIFWMNSAWDSMDTWNRFLKDKDWNTGGERVWVAPELQYCIQDREHVLQSYVLPEAMDPGSSSISRPQADTVQINTEMTLDTYNYSSLQQQITIERTISPAANPLHQLNEAENRFGETIYFGYKHTINLGAPAFSSVKSETWNIMQVRQGGTVLLPIPDSVQPGLYLPPSSELFSYRDTSSSMVRLETGNLFKVGFPSAYCTGRIGYLSNNTITDTWTLLIRSYFVNPSGLYTEEPFGSPGDNGYAFHIYNSEDPAHCFGELECQGESIGNGLEQNRSSDTMLTWFFQGAYDSLLSIAAILLHIPERELHSSLDHQGPSNGSSIP